MKKRCLALLLTLLLSPVLLAEEAPALKPPVKTEADLEPYQPQLKKITKQLQTLGLLAKATGFGPVRIQVPQELQKIPLDMIDGAKALTDRDIELYVKELEFDALSFADATDPVWVEDTPVLPSLLSFKKIGFKVDAKTRMGRSLGGQFFDGSLPLDFAPQKEDYAVQVIPERRKEEAKLGPAKVQLGGPVASGIVSKFFGQKIAELILQYGVGQTLQMNQGDLLGQENISKLLGLKGVESEVANSVLDTFLK